MVIEMPAALVFQQALAPFTQMQAVMDPLVIKKSQPHARDQPRGCIEATGCQIQYAPQQSRHGQAVERMNQNFVTIARVAVMIEVKLVNDPPYLAIVRSPVKEETMQEVLQQTPSGETDHNQHQKLGRLESLPT